MNSLKRYSPLEETINIVSHAIGLVLSFVATFLLVNRAVRYGTSLHILSVSIFGVSLISLYAASTFYHSARRADLRMRFRILDHSTIYILIAGTYTPFTLITLNSVVGWVIFGVSWVMAVAGVIMKLFFTGKYDLVSTLMYVFMGWMIVFAFEPLIANLSTEGLFWLFAGGIAYTTGAVLYSIKKIKLNHAIFHLFVLLGSFCHVMSVYVYVIPSG